MTFLWFVIWLIDGTPAVATWNSWAVALAVCVFLDLFRNR